MTYPRTIHLTLKVILDRHVLGIEEVYHKLHQFNWTMVSSPRALAQFLAAHSGYLVFGSVAATKPSEEASGLYVSRAEDPDWSALRSYGYTPALAFAQDGLTPSPSGISPFFARLWGGEIQISLDEFSDLCKVDEGYSRQLRSAIQSDLSARRYDYSIDSNMKLRISRPAAISGDNLSPKAEGSRPKEPACSLVLVLGTTGAGKSSLLRQLLGTTAEKFPATSPNKTTVSPTQVSVNSSDLYQASVLFHDRDAVKMALEENVSEAVRAICAGKNNSLVAHALLTHPSLTFRFDQIFGRHLSRNPKRRHQSTPAEVNRHNIIEGWIDALRNGADGGGLSEATDQNREEVVQQMLASLAIWEHERGRGEWLMEEGWPTRWQYGTRSRTTFMTELRRFTSNNRQLMGTLLTPLVKSVEISGPFTPTWAEGHGFLTYLDTEGLGHQSTVSGGLTNVMKERMRDASAILLVDNAKQPVQAYTQWAIEEIARTGAAHKYFHVFTRMDGIKGDNLEDDQLVRRAHIRSSLEHVVTELLPEVGPFAQELLMKRVFDATYYLSHLQDVLDLDDPDGAASHEELVDLYSAIKAASADHARILGLYEELWDSTIRD